MKLKDRAALVTGGASGIGQAVCRAFAAEGARVVVVDLDEDGARATADELTDAIAVRADVALSADAESAVARAVERFGRLDVLANVAGYSADSPDAPPPAEVLTSMTDEQWRRMIDVNLSGTFYFMRAALRVMVAQRSGSIINTSSINGLNGGGPGLPHYAAAKAGILGLTRAVAKEVVASGIRVNAIAPGPVETPLARRAASSDPTLFPMRRRARPEELADAYVWLASDQSSYVTGETVNVNGGLLTI